MKGFGKAKKDLFAFPQIRFWLGDISPIPLPLRPENKRVNHARTIKRGT